MAKPRKRIPYSSTEAIDKRIARIRKRLESRWSRRSRLETRIATLCDKAEWLNLKIAEDYAELQRQLRKRAKSTSLGNSTKL